MVLRGQIKGRYLCFRYWDDREGSQEGWDLIRYTTEAKLKLGESTLTGASNLKFVEILNFLVKNVRGTWIFLILNGGIKVHGGGLF